MSDPVFLRHAHGLTLAQIVELTGAAPLPPPLLSRRVVDIAPLERAPPYAITFFDKKVFASSAASSHAGACLTSVALAKLLPERIPALIVGNPYSAFVAVARELFPHALRPSSFAAADAVVRAHVDHTARLENGATIEPGAVIGPHVEVGGGTVIGAGAILGPDVRIGRDCSVGAGVIITNAFFGDRVTVHPGCKIGQDGFEYVADRDRRLKVPYVGRVIIQDDVEIGAGTTIDRGTIQDTVIGEGTKIDNLVQVGHNVRIGRHCTLVAQSGIADGSVLEDFVVLSARVGVSANVTIGEGAQLAAASNVHADVPAGARWGGTPAKPLKRWFREIRALAKISRPRDNAETVVYE